jgi:hypothetical protein
MSAAQAFPSISVPASGDLSATVYRFADVNSSGQIVNASAGGRAMGVRTSAPAAQGRPANITPGGIELVECGAAVTRGGPVKSDSVGRCVDASADDVINGLARGIAMETGAAAGERIEVWLFPTPSIVASSGVETLTGAGAASIDYLITEMVATSDAVTLADGHTVGQRKIARLVVGSTGSNTFTPATVSANTDGGTSPAALTFTTIGQEAEWEWRSDGWKLVRLETAGIGAVTNASTINLLHATNHATIDGTDVITLPNGYFDGQEMHITVIAAANTPVMDVGGLFYLEAGGATGVNVTFDAAAVFNYMQVRWSGARWQVIAHLNANVE